MNKPYLLMAGDRYYPSDGTGDWIGCFSTYAQAREQVVVRDNQCIVKGWVYGDRTCDWFEIIDLREWTK